MACFQTGLTGKSADGTAPADPVTRSLRFDGSAYFSRSTGSTSTTWTLSFWVKRATISGPSQQQYIATWAISGSAGEGIAFRGTADSSNLDKIGFWTGSTQHYSTAVYRDPAAWAHICISVNSGTATVYYNGESILSSISGIQAWGSMRLGSWLNQNELEGYMADVYGIEGSALDHTSFTESNDYGGLKPKAYTGSFGTNGFHIDAQPTHDADLLVSSIDRNDGDTLFADAAKGHTLTTGGDPEHSIAVGNPFTGDDRAIDFGSSTSNYLEIWDGSTGDYNLTGDYTLEGWYYTKDTVDYSTLFGHKGPDWFSLYVHTTYGLTWYNDGLQMFSSVDWEHNKWNHVAVTYDSSGGTYNNKMWLNGVLVAQGTKSQTYNFSSSYPLHLGTLQGFGSSYWGDGYAYDVRISSSIRYTDTFDVPTEKFTDDSDTELLLQPDNSDSDWDDVDKSHNSHGVTEYGTVTRTASTPYDAAAKSTAMYFDGSGDYLTVPTHDNLKPESGDFTVEAWINYSSIPSSSNGSVIYSICGNGTTSSTACFMLKPNGHLGWYTGDTHYTGSSATAMSADTWYHVAAVRSSGTVKLYIDGDEDYSATHSGNLNATNENRVGARSATPLEFDGYMYDLRFTKGEARYTSDFTKPSAPFELNPIYIGGDQSGNKNHFEPTNISGHDVMLDVPTKNYATLNPLDKGSSTLLLEGNCGISQNTNNWVHHARSTFSVSSGKWYWECTDNNGWGGSFWKTGIAPSGGTIASALSGAYTYYAVNGSGASSGSSWSSGDIIGIALDLDNGTCYIYKNNSSMGTLVASGLSGEYSPYHDSYNSQTIYNFGQDPSFNGGKTSGQDTSQSEFYYAPPTGFKSLNTSNLDDPTVTPEENFNIALYNGTSSSNSITGLGFQPDILWTKSRSTSGSSPKIFDSIRGVTKRLQPDQATVEQTVTELTSFDSDGFTLGSDSGSNYSGRTYVGWCWKAHQSPTSNTTTYTVKVEDNSGDAWDYSGSYYDSSTYLPSVYMEIFENRNSSLVSLGKVAVRSYDSSGNSNSDLSEQTYTLECADLNAIAVKWHYDTSGDGDEYDYPNYYNDYLNDQKITILDGTTSEWTTNNYSNDDGTSSNYSPPTGWANGDTLKSATTSYNGSDTATLTSGSSSGPTEKYNADAGFTIISYAGDGFTDGDSQTLNHSLGVPLDFVIAKPRTNNQSMGGNWVVWHKDLGNYEYLLLNSSSAKKTDYNSNEVIDTATSGSQHQVVVNNGYDGSNYHYLNMGPYSGSAGEDYILYGWAGVEGYSKFGTYKGAGSNGVFVYTGHRPKVVWIKNMDTTGNWFIFDAARDTYNETVKYILANTSNSETTNSGYKIDILSNGFKINVESTHMNNPNYDYVFCSFSESPFKHANAR